LSLLLRLHVPSSLAPGSRCPRSSLPPDQQDPRTPQQGELLERQALTLFHATPRVARLVAQSRSLSCGVEYQDLVLVVAQPGRDAVARLGEPREVQDVLEHDACQIRVVAPARPRLRCVQCPRYLGVESLA